MTIAAIVRDTRTSFGWSQRELASRADVGRSTIATIEAGARNATIELVGSVLDALGVRVDVSVAQPALIDGVRRGDRVHSWSVAFAARRLAAQGWVVRTEVEVMDGRFRGWIDVLAFHPPSGRLLVIEVKTVLDDIGGLMRQVSRYERLALAAARQFGWRPRASSSWLLVLATDAADIAIRENDRLLRDVFPTRARDLMTLLREPEASPSGRRGLALIDPSDPGSRWLKPSSIDARRVIRRRFRGYADAAHHVQALAAQRPRRRRMPVPGEACRGR